MASYQLTEDARDDLDSIYEYSIVNFGLSKARDYFNGLHECCQMLADHTRLGRDYSHVKDGCYRYEYESHSVYYRITETGVLILRVLHQRMDPGRHLT